MLLTKCSCFFFYQSTHATQLCICMYLKRMWERKECPCCCLVGMCEKGEEFSPCMSVHLCHLQSVLCLSSVQWQYSTLTMSRLLSSDFIFKERHFQHLLPWNNYNPSINLSFTRNKPECFYGVHVASITVVKVSGDQRKGNEKQQRGEDWRGNCFGMYITHSWMLL